MERLIELGFRAVIGFIGLALMFFQDWKMALGVVLLLWCENINRKYR